MTGKQPSEAINHINHIKSDNRWSNIEDAGKPGNDSWRMCHVKGQMLGARRDRKRWMARLPRTYSETNTQLYLGSYATMKEAGTAVIYAFERIKESIPSGRASRAFAKKLRKELKALSREQWTFLLSSIDPEKAAAERLESVERQV